MVNLKELKGILEKEGYKVEEKFGNLVVSKDGISITIFIYNSNRKGKENLIKVYNTKFYLPTKNIKSILEEIESQFRAIKIKKKLEEKGNILKVELEKLINQIFPTWKYEIYLDYPEFTIELGKKYTFENTIQQKGSKLIIKIKDDIPELDFELITCLVREIRKIITANRD